MSFQRIAKYFLGLSATLVVASLIILVYPGPKFSIEFTGGTLLDVQLPADKTKDNLSAVVSAFKTASGTTLGNISVSSIRDLSGGSSLVIRMRPLSNDEHLALITTIQKAFPTMKELKFDTIGPSVSASLKQRTFIALGVASVAIVLYLAFAFRKLPRRLSPWKFGLLAVIAFIHDVIITAGVFVLIGQFTSFEFDTLFVTALLTILAYSTNDTIVIFDRIRANISYENRSESFAETAARGLKQSVTRTLNTMMSVLIMLSALYFLGSESIRWFILALMFGMIIGTYSSYFVASALLIYWR